MRRRRLLLVVGLLVVTAAAALAQPSPQVLLRYKFTPGQVWAYDLNMTGAGAVVVSGLPETGEVSIPLAVAVNMPLAEVVRAVDAQGNGTLGVQLSTMGMETTALGKTTHLSLDFPRGRMEVDGQPQPLPGPSLAEALEKLSMVVSPQGQLLKVEGLDPLTKAMEKTPPGGFNPLNPGGLIQMKSLLTAYSPAFPLLPVAVGDTWEEKLTLPASAPGAAPNELLLRYTLEKLGQVDGRPLARIGMEGRFEITDMPTPPDQPGGQPGKLDRLVMTVAGQMFLDLDAGQLHSARMALGLDMSAGGAQPAGGGPPPHMEIRGLKLLYNVTPRADTE